MNKSLAIIGAGALIIVALLIFRPHHPENTRTPPPPPHTLLTKKTASRGPFKIPQAESKTAEQENPPQEAPKGYIRGRPAEQARHIATQFFLQHSYAKDTVEGQTIARELLKNGYGPEHISPVHNAAHMLFLWTNKYPLDNERNIRIFNIAKKGQMSTLINGVESEGISPIKEALAEKLLDLRPATPYLQNNAPGIFNAVQGTNDKYLEAQDILEYINAHPAKPGSPSEKG